MAVWKNPEWANLSGPDADSLRRIFNSLSTALQPLGALPAGTIVPFAGTTLPDGWLWADGTTGLNAVANPQYESLYDAIGTTYGGASKSNFALPDMRGRVAVAMDNLGGSDAGRLAAANTLGGSGGAETVALTVSNLPTNNLVLRWQTNTTATGASTRVTDFGGISGATGGSTGNVNVGGSGTAHNNMPPYILMNYIIKL